MKVKLDEPPYRYAIYVWRAKLRRHGLTLPMLAAFSVWYRGGRFDDIETVKAEAKLIAKEMYKSPDCTFPEIAFKNKHDDLGMTGVATERQFHLQINTFTCGLIHELVYGLTRQYGVLGELISPTAATKRYVWNGVSKNGGIWGNLTDWDISFFRCVAGFIEKGEL